jgi:hypothetical protein
MFTDCASRVTRIYFIDASKQMRRKPDAALDMHQRYALTPLCTIKNMLHTYNDDSS